MRLYPLYLLCLLLGIVTTRLYAAAFIAAPWGPEAALPSLGALALKHQTVDHFGPNLIAHLTMLHGILPDDLIYGAATTFLIPAWSLSLEWQFYLLAPAILYAFQHSPATRLALAIVALTGYGAFQTDILGFFPVPSCLPGAVPLFAVGIATRLGYVKLPRLAAFPVVSALMGAAITTMGAGYALAPFYLWALFVAWLRMDRAHEGARAQAKTAGYWLLQSTAARYAGALSYAIYPVHIPVIQGVLAVCARHLHLDRTQSTVILCITTPPLTLVLAAILHRWVEMPFIRLGKLLTHRSTSRLAAA